MSEPSESEDDDVVIRITVLVMALVIWFVCFGLMLDTLNGTIP